MDEELRLYYEMKLLWVPTPCMDENGKIIIIYVKPNEQH
jgi:hypothetical protein